MKHSLVHFFVVIVLIKTTQIKQQLLLMNVKEWYVTVMNAPLENTSNSKLVWTIRKYQVWEQ